MQKLYFLTVFSFLAGSVSALDVKYAERNAVIHQSDRSIQLRSIGDGLRWKPVSFLGIRVDVYQASSFLDTATKFDRNQPLRSVENAPAKIMRLTFLRDLEASKIRESMETALRANDVDPEKGAVGKLFAQFQFSIKSGEVMSILGLRQPNGTELVEIQIPGKVISAEGTGLAADLWKGWYGKPADSGIEALQKSLLSGS